jgi:hypothetical protein
MGGQARHISSDGRSRQKICSRRRRLSFGIRALIHPRTLNCQASDPYEVRGMPGVNRLYSSQSLRLLESPTRIPGRRAARTDIVGESGMNLRRRPQQGSRSTFVFRVLSLEG